MKRFVKDATQEEKGASLYQPHVTVNYVKGKPPYLIIYEGETEVERVGLSTFNTEELHELMRVKGFPRADGGGAPGVKEGTAAAAATVTATVTAEEQEQGVEL